MLFTRYLFTLTLMLSNVEEMTATRHQRIIETVNINVFIGCQKTGKPASLGLKKHDHQVQPTIIEMMSKVGLDDSFEGCGV